MSDELQFKLRERPMTDDEHRRMVDAFAAAFPVRVAFGAELCAAIEQAERTGEAIRQMYLREFANFAPAVESLRLMVAQTLAAVPKFTIPALPPAALEALRGVAAREAASRHAFALAFAADLRPARVRIDVVIRAEGEM